MLTKLRALLVPRLGTHPMACNRRRRRGFVPSLECLEDRVTPSTFTVTTTLDVVAADGRLSLREAINQANAHPGADTIVVPTGVYRLALRGADNTNAAGDLDVTGSTVFQGFGAGQSIIDGQKLDRVFDVLGTAPSSIKVTLQGMTVRNGLADDGGGGGIRVGNADLVVQDCAITGNRTDGDGGGISNVTLPGTGNVTLVRTTVNRNVAVAGGGIAVRANAQNQGSVLNVNGSTIRRNLGFSGGGIFAVNANLAGSVISGNFAADGGGGIFAIVANLTGCTVSGNSAATNGGGISATAATLANTAVSGNSTNRSGGGIFVNVATLTKCTVTGNFAAIDSGGIEAFTATLTSCTVSGNHASGDGGGLFAETATLTNSVLSRNTAAGFGGGITGGTVTLTNCTVSGNSAVDGGGMSTTTATLTNSTVNDNVASNGDGGGIDADTATLTNSTVSGNHASGRGGGISAAVSLSLLNVTVTENDAQDGGGVFLRTGATSSVRNTIAAANLVTLDGVAPDVSGAFTSGGHNLIGDATASTGFTNGTKGDQVGTEINPIDPRLGPLANNGGPTRTHALLSGSPAIDHGDNANAPAIDQRGVSRPRDGDGNGSRIVDIGAFER